MLTMASKNLDFSRELRGWAKLLKNAENVKKIESLTVALNGLKTSFSEVNGEMKMFNTNAKESNEFLGRIARLQESMDAQTKAANKLSWLVLFLAIIQVVIAAITLCKTS